MSTAIKVENLSKLYRLGEIGTGTISKDIQRWITMNVLGKENRQPISVNRQQTTETKQPKPDNRQQSTDNRQPITNNRQQSTDNRQPNNRKQALY